MAGDERMIFTFRVDIEVNRDEGKFASREEISEQLAEALADADPGSVEGNEGGQYSVSSWEVNEEEQPKKKRAAKVKS
jgi:hypothetical protein